MPLTKRQFELGVDDEGEIWMRQIYELLAENRNLAYSSGELEEAVLGTSVPIIKLEKFTNSLDVLILIRAVEKRWLDDTGYYAHLQEFDTGTWKSTKLPIPPPPPARSST